MEKTNIYFIGSIEQGAVKIGRAKDPKKRLAQLQTGNSNKLTLFAVVENVTPEYEFKLHKLMDHIRLEGEWFQLTDELIYFMINKTNTNFTTSFDEELSQNELKKVMDNLIIFTGDLNDFLPQYLIAITFNQYFAKQGLYFSIEEIEPLLEDIGQYYTKRNGNVGYSYHKLVEKSQRIDYKKLLNKFRRERIELKQSLRDLKNGDDSS